MKLQIIFRGQGKRLSSEEWDFYRGLDNVTVRFQPKAWADEIYMQKWFMAFRESTLDLGEVMLGMDRHGSQKTPLCMAFMKSFGIVPVFTPPNCTDCVSPVDHHIGKTLKTKIRKLAHEEFDGDGWHGGDLKVMDKRMKVAYWASVAWRGMCENSGDLFRSAFVSTGFLLAKDGSENNLVKLWKANNKSTNVSPTGEEYNF